MNDKTKKILIIGSAITLASLIVFTALLIKRKRKATSLIKKVRIKNKEPKKILIVGDSQSAIKNASGDSITYTYPNMLKKVLEPKGIKIDVLALGGKTTKWMLDNLPEQLEKDKYDRVYIYGGGNDASTSSIDIENTTLSNIQKMVDMSKEKGADVIVNQGYRIEGEEGKFGNWRIMPLSGTLLDKREQWIPLIERRKKLQELLPKRIKNANFIPVYDLKGLTIDGIHPTQQGHELVAQQYLKTLNYENR